MKNLILTFILASLSISNIALASGGQDGTGGNAGDTGPISRSEIADLLARAKVPALYALRRVEMIYSPYSRDAAQPQPLVDSLYRKLFGGSYTAYQALNAAHFNLLQDGACPAVDEHGNHVDRDGAAIEPDQICFSLERLAGRLNRDDAENEVVSFLLHEVSHLVGGDEAEASFLQFSVRSQSRIQMITTVPTLVQNYRAQLTATISGLTTVLNLIDHGNDVEICSGFTGLFGMIGQLNQMNFDAISSVTNDGILFSRPQDLQQIQAELLRGGNLMAACLPSLPFSQTVAAAFGSHSQLSIAEFTRLVMEPVYSGHHFPIPPGTIRSVHLSDRAVIKQEIEDVQREMTTVQQNF